MALKPHQKAIADDINFVCTTVAEAGCLVIYKTVAGQVSKPTGTTGISEPSGKAVAGVLMIDVVNRGAPALLGLTGEPLGLVDATQSNKILSRNETHISGQVRLLKIGECSTNVVDASDSFVNGDKLYITNLGKFSKVQDSAAHQAVGRALGAKDADGYLKVFVNIL